jgi:hypothetical protein
LHRATILSNVSIYYKTQGRYGIGFNKYSKTLTARKKKLNTKYLHTEQRQQSGLGTSGFRKYKKAEEMHRRILKEYEKILEIEYPNILISVSNLAEMLRDQDIDHKIIKIDI